MEVLLFLLQDQRRLQEIKWRMFYAPSQPLIPDMTAPPPKKVGEGEGGRRQAGRKNVTKRFLQKLKRSRAELLDHRAWVPPGQTQEGVAGQLLVIAPCIVHAWLQKPRSGAETALSVETMCAQ